MHDMFAKYIRTDLAAEQYSVLETEYAKENRGIQQALGNRLRSKHSMNNK